MNLYKELDAKCDSLVTSHASNLKCQPGCTNCCIDGLSVFRVEAEFIRTRNSELLKNTEPFPSGACAFLNGSGNCRIYEDRPYVCRTQGLPLRWFDCLEDGTPVEYRDICPENETDIVVEEIDPELCWLIGPFEEKLASLQAELDNGEMNRVNLRDLFNK